MLPFFFFLGEMCLDMGAACGDTDSISTSRRRELPCAVRKAGKFLEKAIISKGKRNEGRQKTGNKEKQQQIPQTMALMWENADLSPQSDQVPWLGGWRSYRFHKIQHG